MTFNRDCSIKYFSCFKNEVCDFNFFYIVNVLENSNYSFSKDENIIASNTQGLIFNLSHNSKILSLTKL